MNATLARGLYYALQRWRHEPVDRVLAELEASQHWPLDRLLAQQRSRRDALIRHAVATVPWYRQQHGRLATEPSDAALERAWQDWPPLEKRALQEQSAALRSERASAGLAATTSGSSGTPVAVLRSHASWAHAHANVFRGWRWHGLDCGDPYAYFWGLALDASGRRQAGWRDLVFNRRRLSAFETDPGRMRAFYDDLRRRPARFAFGYPSAVMQFSDFVRDHGLDGTALRWRAVVTSAEVLRPHQRERMAETFGCRVVDSYGCAEAGVAGFECEHGGMHVPVESVCVDLLPAEDGLHEILLTDLHNDAAPVIRYRVGDLVERVDGACGCGRALPRLGRIVGRAGEALTLPDGRRINALLPYYLFRPYAKSGQVREYQFAEHADGTLEVRVVAGAAWEEALRHTIADEVARGLGMPVRVSRVDAIERGARGKHRDWVKVAHGAPPPP